MPSTRSQFLVGGFVRLRADEVLSITGKYPKGAGGGQRVQVSWPPPDPPLLSYSAPLASQGRAQRSSHPFPGGPLSPSAQSIPPPAPGRRFIPGVMARDCHGRDTLGEGLPPLPAHARRVPNAAQRDLGEVACFPLPVPCKGKSPPTLEAVFSCREPLSAGKFPCFSLYKRGVFCYNETQRFRTVCPGCRSLRRRTWWTAMSAPRPSWPPQYRSPRAKKNGGKTHDQERDHRRLCPSRGRHRFP